MTGKIIKINDYKLTYGQGTVYATVYAAFAYNGSKYIIYSRDENKLYWGSLFIRKNEAVVMQSKGIDSSCVKDYVDLIINNKKDEKYETISLDDINSIQIIDELLCDFKVDLQELYDKTIPKKEVVNADSNVEKKGISIMNLFFILFLLVLGAFFFFNPEVITGKNVTYNCNKTYSHDKLPANVSERIKLVFTSKGVISSIDIRTDYVFSNHTFYNEFRENSEFYQYFKNGDTYKFDDSTYTYRLFSKVDVKNDYFGATKKDELISYYENDNYKCEIVNEE